MTYCYTVENTRHEDGKTVFVETLYPLSVGMHVWIPLRYAGMKKVKEILMYHNEAVIVVEEV